jgi:hypothetical protein
MENDVAAITCFLNFENDLNKVNNFIKFKEKLKEQGVPLFVIEVISEGNIPHLSKICNDQYFLERILLPTLIKGNALNVLSSKVPKKYKNIAWLNSDVLISDDDWAEKASVLLKEYKLVRLNRELKHESPAVVNRKFFEDVGIFDLDFCGETNLITHLCSINHDLLFDEKDLLDLYSENNLNIFYKILSYRNRCYNYFKEDIKFLDMKIETLSEKKDPPLEESIKLLKEIDIDSNIHYERIHKIIALKNIHGLDYHNKMSNLFK